jgi:hypothetical protein
MMNTRRLRLRVQRLEARLPVRQMTVEERRERFLAMCRNALERAKDPDYVPAPREPLDERRRRFVGIVERALERAKVAVGMLPPPGLL